MSDMMEKRRKLLAEQPASKPSPYQVLYGLRENPFPLLPLFSPASDDPRRNGSIYDNGYREDEERRFFDLFIQPPADDTPVTLGFVRAAPQSTLRGTGKSTFLNRMMCRINDQDWGTWPPRPEGPDLFALGVHVLPEPRRQKRFWQFTRLVFETMADRNLFARIDSDFRAAMLLRTLTERQIAQLSGKPDEEMKAALACREAFARLLGEYDVSIATVTDKARAELSVMPGAEGNWIVDGFLKSGLDLSALWREWQQNGLAASDYQWRKNGAEWLVDGLAAIMVTAGYRRLVILLDEFEKIYLYQTTREREEFLDELRQRFYERDSVAVRRGLVSAVLAMHPSIDPYLKDVWARVGLDHLAPLTREQMPNLSVELGRSIAVKINRLLIRYLDEYRLTKEDRGTLYPFGDGAMEPAMDAATFYPRGTLWFAHAILRKAAEQNVPPPISRHFVEDFVASGQRPPQGADEEGFKLPETEAKLTE